MTWHDGVQAPRAETVKNGWGKPVAKPEAPTRAGYTFGGWYADEACTTPFDFGAAQKSDVYVYAKWTKVAEQPAAPAGDAGRKQNPKTGV